MRLFPHRPSTPGRGLHGRSARPRRRLHPLAQADVKHLRHQQSQAQHSVKHAQADLDEAVADHPGRRGAEPLARRAAVCPSTCRSPEPRPCCAPAARSSASSSRRGSAAAEANWLAASSCGRPADHAGPHRHLVLQRATPAGRDDVAAPVRSRPTSPPATPTTASSCPPRTRLSTGSGHHGAPSGCRPARQGPRPGRRKRAQADASCCRSSSTGAGRLCPRPRRDERAPQAARLGAGPPRPPDQRILASKARADRPPTADGRDRPRAAPWRRVPARPAAS